MGAAIVRATPLFSLCFPGATNWFIISGHMTDVGIVPHGAVEEPVEDKQSLQTPEGQKEDEDEDTDTDDGALGDEGDVHGS